MFKKSKLGVIKIKKIMDVKYIDWFRLSNNNCLRKWTFNWNGIN